MQDQTTWIGDTVKAVLQRANEDAARRIAADLDATPERLTEFLAEREVAIQTSGDSRSREVARENWSAVGGGGASPDDIIQPVDGRDLSAAISCLSQTFYPRRDGTVANRDGETVSTAARAFPEHASLHAAGLALGYSLGVTAAAKVVDSARKHRRLTAALVHRLNDVPVTAGNDCPAHD